MSTNNNEEIKVPRKPNGGVYGDDEFWKAYIDLFNDVANFIPSDRSHGALMLNGAGAAARARCKNIVYKAKIMEEAMKAATYGR